MKNKNSVVLVTIQVVCIAFLILTTPIKTSPFYCDLWVGLGLLFGLWAVWSMRLSKISLLPDVKKSAVLIKFGPYKYVRHPMYLAVLLVCFGLMLGHISGFRFIVYLILVGDLLAKIDYEEKLLGEHFSDYHIYQTHTHRLIPFIY